MPLITPSQQRHTLFRSSAPEPGFHVGPDECPWIPGEPGTWNKFMLFDLRRNAFCGLLRMEPGASLLPHFHTTPVVGYVVKGRWRYREYDWVAGPGSFIYETAGEVHTLENVGDEDMIFNVHVTGPHITVDEHGRQTGYADAFSVLEYVRAWCRETGHDDAFLDRIVR